eukprot:9470286-Pyramimonas_sp.AAC.1
MWVRFARPSVSHRCLVISPSFSKRSFSVTRVTMVEGHSVHRVAHQHRQRLVGKSFQTSSPNGRWEFIPLVIIMRISMQREGSVLLPVESDATSAITTVTGIPAAWQHFVVSVRHLSSALDTGVSRVLNRGPHTHGRDPCRFTEGAKMIDGKPYKGIEAVGKNLFAFFGEEGEDPVIMHVHFGMSGVWAIFDEAKEAEPDVKETTRLRMYHKASGLITHLSAMTVRRPRSELSGINRRVSTLHNACNHQTILCICINRHRSQIPTWPQASGRRLDWLL